MGSWWSGHCEGCGEVKPGTRPDSPRTRYCGGCAEVFLPERQPEPFRWVPITYRWTAEHRARRRAEIRAESVAARAA